MTCRSSALAGQSRVFLIYGSVAGPRVYCWAADIEYFAVRVLEYSIEYFLNITVTATDVTLTLPWSGDHSNQFGDRCFATAKPTLEQSAMNSFGNRTSAPSHNLNDR